MVCTTATSSREDPAASGFRPPGPLGRPYPRVAPPPLLRSSIVRDSNADREQAQEDRHDARVGDVRVVGLQQRDHPFEGLLGAVLVGGVVLEERRGGAHAQLVHPVLRVQRDYVVGVELAGERRPVVLVLLQDLLQALAEPVVVDGVLVAVLADVVSGGVLHLGGLGTG